MSQLALSESFEYLCHVSTVIINIFTRYTGIDFRCQNLTSKDGPRAVRVNNNMLQNI